LSATTYEDVSVIVRDGVIYAGCNGHIFALSPDGRILWHNPLKGVGYNDISMAFEGQSVQYIQKTVHHHSSSVRTVEGAAQSGRAVRIITSPPSTAPRAVAASLFKSKLDVVHHLASSAVHTPQSSRACVLHPLSRSRREIRRHMRLNGNSSVVTGLQKIGQNVPTRAILRQAYCNPRHSSSDSTSRL
jgi:hypothetical protein